MSTRLPFLVAVALIGAALADPIVESIANTGIVGAGYADTTRCGIGPTLLAGLAVVFTLLVPRLVSVWRQSTAGFSAKSLVQVAREFPTGSFARDLPLVFGLQIMALFLLESGEQLTTDGRLLGGTIWLGGPIVFSLLMHALFSGACLFALGAVMRAIVHAFAALVRTAIRFIWLTIVEASCGAVALVGRDQPCLRAQAPRARQFGGRAPPRLA